MNEALKIPGNYAEQLPQTIAELKAQQEYFNQLELAAEKIQAATDNYNKLLEQGLTAIPANNIDYNGSNSEQTEKEIEEINTETSQVEEENQDSEEVNEYNEPKTNSEEDIETEQYSEVEEETYNQDSETTEKEISENDNEVTENVENNEEGTDEADTEEDETQSDGPKINLNSLLNKDKND